MKSVYFARLPEFLKPGGVAILTTEYCISEPPYLLPGVQAMDAALFRAITDQASCFDVVGAWDLSYNWNHPVNGVHVRRFIPPYFSPLLKIGGPRLAALKGGQMANAVGLSLIAPIAFVLRRRPTGALPDWDKIELPPVYRVMSDGAHPFRPGSERRGGIDPTAALGRSAGGGLADAPACRTVRPRRGITQWARAKSRGRHDSALCRRSSAPRVAGCRL